MKSNLTHLPDLTRSEKTVLVCPKEIPTVYLRYLT